MVVDAEAGEGRPDMITELLPRQWCSRCRSFPRRRRNRGGAATSALTGSACSPYGFHWAFGTHALVFRTGGALVKMGSYTLLLLTADDAFGYALEKDVTLAGG